MIKLKLSDACTFLNSLSEQNILDYFNGDLDAVLINQIDNWCKESDEFKQAILGYKEIFDSLPDKAVNNFFQKSKEDFTKVTSLKLASNLKQ